MTENEKGKAPLDIDFVLTGDDRRTEAWAKIYKALEARIWKLRVKNDKVNMSVEDRLALTTEIRILKGMLRNDPSKEFSLPRDAVLIEDLDAD